jgi:hypothetical protein
MALLVAGAAAALHGIDPPKADECFLSPPAGPLVRLAQTTQFYYNNPEQLLMRYDALMNVIDEMLSRAAKYFKREVFDAAWPNIVKWCTIVYDALAKLYAAVMQKLMQTFTCPLTYYLHWIEWAVWNALLQCVNVAFWVGVCKVVFKAFG